jgi:hypothetical protein
MVTALVTSIVLAGEARLCVMKTTADSAQGGAFRHGPGSTPAFVRVRVDKGEAKRVSPTEAAEFAVPAASHIVSVLAYDGDALLTSFRAMLDGTLCMMRKPDYGTWSVSPCECP